ncbi:unannotated protein [freshwater metagenome]|uniref:Unannotated protein n=1 Tax=freshwater metagenome TaxID=449393 RepID=A0A6J6RXI3_9ZZZZ
MRLESPTSARQPSCGIEQRENQSHPASAGRTSARWVIASFFRLTDCGSLRISRRQRSNTFSTTPIPTAAAIFVSEPSTLGSSGHSPKAPRTSPTHQTPLSPGSIRSRRLLGMMRCSRNSTSLVRPCPPSSIQADRSLRHRPLLALRSSVASLAINKPRLSARAACVPAPPRSRSALAECSTSWSAPIVRHQGHAATPEHSRSLHGSAETKLCGALKPSCFQRAPTSNGCVTTSALLILLPTHTSLPNNAMTPTELSTYLHFSDSEPQIGTTARVEHCWASPAEQDAPISSVPFLKASPNAVPIWLMQPRPIPGWPFRHCVSMAE